MSIESQRRDANLLVHRLYNLDKNVCIAGGAPRDWFFGKPARDLDVYFCWNGHASFPGKFLTQELAGWKSDYSIEGKAVDYSALDLPISHIRSGTLGTTPVQLIMLKEQRTPAQVVQSFDTGICMASLGPCSSGGPTLHYTPEFYKDYDTMSITLRASTLSPENLQKSIVRHIPKLLKKFPDYRLVVE